MTGSLHAPKLRTLPTIPPVSTSQEHFTTLAVADQVAIPIRFRWNVQHDVAVLHPVFL